MLHYIKGKITAVLPGMVAIENNGMGYEVYVPENSPAYLANREEEIRLYTAMIVREDDISLYGFTEKDSLALFRKLMTVSGVGAKAALAILSAMPLGDVLRAIAFEDAATLTRANGIGKKTAQRIVLDLKDKVGLFDAKLVPASESNAAADNAKEEAVAALITLGYTKSEAMSAMAGIPDTNLTAEEYIKRALRQGV
jgi:holliday junction DNA helicase RuvA